MEIDRARKEKLEKELRRIVHVLRNRYAPEKILLFGSLVGGSVGAWSDLDLVIIKSTRKRFLERLKEVAILTQPRVGVDFFVYTPAEFAQMTSSGETFQRREMLDKGKVIYDGSRTR